MNKKYFCLKTFFVCQHFAMIQFGTSTAASSITTNVYDNNYTTTTAATSILNHTTLRLFQEFTINFQSNSTNPDNLSNNTYLKTSSSSSSSSNIDSDIVKTVTTINDVGKIRNGGVHHGGLLMLDDGDTNSSNIIIRNNINNNNSNNNSNNSNNGGVTIINTINYNESVSGFDTLSWDRTTAVAFFFILIIITIIGNTLIILSVITTRRLRTVTNCFVMSLAVADWMVGIFVMPPAVLLYVYDRWTVGWILCDIWISLDILLCTASILSLCAISLDRYLAVTQPLHYKKRRTKRLALFMIFIVWVVALAITCPPFLGWYEQGRRNSMVVDCRYNQNKGYVIFSAMGSFFIPMTVMLYVYTRICCVLTVRHNSMAKTEASERSTNDEIEPDNLTSEYESCHSPRRSLKNKGNTNNSQAFRTYSNKSSVFDRNESQHSLYELVEISKSASTIRSSTITCKYTTNFKPIQSVHFCQSQTSISESCLSSSKMRVQQRNGKRVPIRISSLKRETKAAQTLSMVVGGFIACWLPFFICYLLIPFLPKESVSLTIMSILTWLGWTSSAINPFIYAFYNTDFRIAFWRLTFRKFCKSQNNLTLLRT